MDLGITNGAAFDIQAVCAGFVYAMTVADNFLRAGQSSRALVIGAETFTRLLDWTDRGTCVLFGDGAGAVVLDPFKLIQKLSNMAFYQLTFIRMAVTGIYYM